MKKLELKPILLSALLILFQSIIFFAAKLIEGAPHLIGNTFDNNIPFTIYFIIPYCIWYILLFLVPYVLYIKDKNNFSKFCISYIFIVLIAAFIFICYPTTVNRPSVDGNNILELITRLIFYIDTPAINCFPSLHCAISMIFMLYSINSNKLNKYFKIIISIISILIMISTLFVKQHVLIDLISGDVIALIVFLFMYKENKLIKKFNSIFKI